tara:strand:- start:63 stop:914 length:852 start_codon:yes stop_codon:yes gene_type:complete
MAEEVEADSTGTTDAASDEGFDLAADLEAPSASNPTESSAAVSGAGTTDFDPNTVDFGKADPESLPAPYREAQTWAKNRERELQGDYTRKSQENADYRRQLEQAQVQLARQNQNAPPPTDPLEDLRRRLGDDAPAIDVVQDIIKAVNGNKQETTSAEVAQLKSAMATMAQHFVSNQSAGLNQQVVEAREAYGDSLDSYAHQIKALINVPNPVTSQAYTVTEAYELLSGKAASKSQELQKTDRQFRSDASQRTALAGAVGAANTDGGDLSAAQLTAGLKQLGFE